MAILNTRSEGTIAVVTLNNPPVNAVSAAVRNALMAEADALDADPEIAAVVLIGAGKTFIAGADVKEFDTPPEPPHLPEVVGRLERAAKPWIAAIRGSALGGGLEIALGCRFRIATPDASLGFPEVSLGLVPGASGTVRTPRLIGLEAASDLILSGTPISAEKAYDIGLIDAVLRGDLESGAIAFAHDTLTRPQPAPLSRRPVPSADDAIWRKARKTAQRPGHQAPLHALSLLQAVSARTFDEAMARERETFLDLRGSPETAALRHVFFAERAARRPAAMKDIPPRKIERIGIVGGGTMGAGIAAACLMSSFYVDLLERDDEGLDAGLARIKGILDDGVRRGKLAQERRRDHLAHLAGGTDYGQLAQSDLVVEAVFERIDTKREVFAALERACKPDAILATNTSYLDPQAIFDGLAHPGRFIGLHFFSPAHLMTLLEIVPIAKTSETVLATAFALARRLGKIPVRAGICEGFIGNRMLKRYRAAAEDLLLAGASVSGIDAAMRAFGYRMGPFESQDLGGLDIAFLQREGARANGEAVPDTIADSLVRADRLGRKSGGGWYDYMGPDAMAHPSDEVGALLATRGRGTATFSDDEISGTLTTALADEGQRILEDGIARTAAEIDLVQVHGYGFPRWKGGPMFLRAQPGQA